MVMKKRVLLIDESLTVQKVVALTLDKSRFSVFYAKSRAEAMSFVANSTPNIILVSDQVSDVTISSFPKEVEAWLGKGRKAPPIILITSQEMAEARHYVAVLQKPFSPQALQTAVTEHADSEVAESPAAGALPHRLSAEEQEEQGLQKRFNDTFNDEARLVRETFQEEIATAEKTLLTIPAPHFSSMTPEPPRLEPEGPPAMVGAPTGAAEVPDEGVVTGTFEVNEDVMGVDARSASAEGAMPSDSGELWQPRATPPPPRKIPDRSAAAGTAPADAENLRPRNAPLVMGSEDSMAYKAVLESRVEDKLKEEELNQVVEKVLERILPPLVERLVKERLDRLLKEEEDFVELKP